MAKHVGQRLRRFEDPRFLQGKGSYVANLELPDMAHAVILRSPYGHATIKNINTSKAAALDGVIAVYTGQDLIDAGDLDGDSGIVVIPVNTVDATPAFSASRYQVQVCFGRLVRQSRYAHGFAKAESITIAQRHAAAAVGIIEF